MHLLLVVGGSVSVHFLLPGIGHLLDAYAEQLHVAEECRQLFVDAVPTAISLLYFFFGMMFILYCNRSMA